MTTLRWRRPRPSSAFTLVELLVVIGVVSVLIALLLPALSKAREQANRLKCAANLRSIGMGLAAYTQIYKVYPSSQFIASSTLEAAVWPARLLPLLDGQKDVFYCPSRPDEFRWSDTGPEPVVRASGYLVDFGYEAGEPLVHKHAPFSYGYNGLGYGDSTFLELLKGLGVWPRHRLVNHGSAGEMPANRVKRPAEMIAVMDSNGDRIQDYNVVPDVTAVWNLPGTVHAKGANVLFCDGHVTWYARAELTVANPRSVAEWPRIRMWNNDHRAPFDQ